MPRAVRNDPLGFAWQSDEEDEPCEVCGAVERARVPEQAPARRGRFAGRRRAAGAAAEQREEEQGELVPMLECGSCLRGFHLDCLDPPLGAVPKARCLDA